MAKDPAVLFYTSDFLTGIIFMNNDEVGQYIKLLCLQHQTGHLDINEINNITKSEKVIVKFVKDKDGKFYNIRMENEIIKRKKYSKSRASNRIGKTKRKKHMKNISLSYEQHMENENENENTNKDTVIKVLKDIKHKYGELNHVLLTDQEYKSLLEKFGESGTKHWIKILDEGLDLKDYKYKSHYRAILKWSGKDGNNRKKDISDNREPDKPGKYEHRTEDFEV
jgi:hypothetical protein